MATKPIKTFMAGNVIISIFREPRNGKNGKFLSYNCSIQNGFSVTNKDTGEITREYNSSFNTVSLMNLMMLIPHVWGFIRTDKAKNKIDEDLE